MVVVMVMVMVMVMMVMVMVMVRGLNKIMPSHKKSTFLCVVAFCAFGLAMCSSAHLIESSNARSAGIE